MFMNQNSNRFFFFLFAVAGFVLGFLAAGIYDAKGGISGTGFPSDIAAFSAQWTTTVSGTVESVDPTSLVLSNNGKSLNILMGENTVVRRVVFATDTEPGATAPATLADVETGNQVGAFLVVNEEGAVVASEIQILPAPPAAPSEE